MIKRIVLTNFMSHAHTVIEPAKGLTVLAGPNNCGKSAVMSALQILCHNENSTYVTRHGEKECSVLVETHNGDVIKWSRNRSTIKYEINGKSFDRLRGTVPPELIEILKLPKVQLEQSLDEFDIHFGSQKDPVFLINESGRAAAGFFAASSDASRLIEMQKRHGQKVKDASRELKRLQDEAEALDSNISSLESVPVLKARFSRCDELAKTIELHENAIADLRKVIRDAKSLGARILRLDSELGAISSLKSPPVMSSTKQLAVLSMDIAKTRRQIDRFEKSAAVLRTVLKPPHQHLTGPLKNLMQSVSREKAKVDFSLLELEAFRSLTEPPNLVGADGLRSLVFELRKANSQVESRGRDLDAIDSSFKKLYQELEQLIVESPNCPSCRQPLSKSHLSRHLNGVEDVNV